MAKINFKELLLSKGEKGLLAIGAIGLGGLLIWSLAAAFGGPDSPSTTVKNMDNQSQRITGGVNSMAESTAPELPDWVTKPSGFSKLNGQLFSLATSPFEPTTEPSKLRDQPLVLTPLSREQGGGAQISLTRSPMPACT